LAIYLLLSVRCGTPTLTAGDGKDGGYNFFKFCTLTNPVKVYQRSHMNILISYCTYKMILSKILFPLFYFVFPACKNWSNNCSERHGRSDPRRSFVVHRESGFISSQLGTSCVRPACQITHPNIPIEALNKKLIVRIHWH